MNAETHSQLADFIWSICNLLRGPYKRNEYRKVILPLTVLRRFDCLLAPTKAQVLKEHAAIKVKPESVVRSLLEKITGRPFYNLAKLDFAKLLDDTNQLAPNLNAYINGFSKNVRDIMDRFAFDQQIARMAEKNLLYEVIKAFSRVDLSPERVDKVQMGFVFEELIRIGAEQANEEAGEHFTPREVIRLMVNLLLSPEQDLRRSHVVKTIYDPACGTGHAFPPASRRVFFSPRSILPAMSTAKRSAEFKWRFKVAAYTEKWAVTMTKVRIRQAVASAPFPRWHLLTFAGPDGGESRGVVDMLAIRKDHSEPPSGAKRGDLFQLILIQVKGGYAAKPTVEDGTRLRIVAKKHGACAVLLATWKKGKAARFFSLRRNAGKAAREWTEVEDLNAIFR